MPRVSLAFFFVAAVFGLLGMIWGVYMGANEDFTQRDAHAHLNLVGWATLSLMGGFYALAGEARPKLLSWINFGLSSLGVALFIPGLATLQSGKADGMMMLGIPGVVMVMLGMTSFIVAIVIVFLHKPASA